MTASTTRAETSADTAVPPVCANPDYDYWVQHVADYDESINGCSKSDIRLHVDYEVGVGASLNCAFQSRQKGHQVCTGPGVGPPCTTAYEYVPHIPVAAFPATIDAAGGDHQNVQINAPGTTLGYEESDAQVLLLLPGVHGGIYPEDAFPSAAVPLLVIQSGGGDASGGNGTPESGPGAGTNTAIPPVASQPKPRKLICKKGFRKKKVKGKPGR